MWSWARSRRSVEASIHAASSRALARSSAGAASPAASSAARMRCAPRLSPRTTQAQPNPLTMASATEWVVFDAPGQRGVDVGALGPGEGEVLGLVAAAHAVGGGGGRVGEPRGVGGEGALGQPGVGHRFERERADAVEQPVPDGARRTSSSSTITSERLASRPTTSIAAAAGTSSASRTDSTAGRGAPPAKVASAHRPRWSSGKRSS